MRAPKLFLSLVLQSLCLLPCAATGSRRTTPPRRCLQSSCFPPRGGGGWKSSPPPPPPPTTTGVTLDFLMSIGGLVKEVGKSLWKSEAVQEAVKMSPADVANKVGSFVLRQQKAASERRKFYQQESTIRETSMVVFSPPRALKLTLLAFVVAEILNFVETTTFPTVSSLEQRAETIKKDLAYQWDNFCKVGLAEGGLLRPETYGNITVLTRAIQEQVEPKYQWALGAAAGFVFSPLCWSLGWTALGFSAVIYLLAETHHLLKARNDKYYYTLKNLENPVIFALDDMLEDLRNFVDHAIKAPKEVFLAMRDDIDERIDFVFPPHVQKGLLFGAVVGVIVGA